MYDLPRIFPPKTKTIKVFESYPAVSLVAGKDLEIIDGDNIIVRTQMPAQYQDVDAVRLVGNQAVVTYDKPGRYQPSLFWTESHVVADFNTWLSLSGKYSLPINDTRLTGYGLLVEDGITTLSGNGVVLSADAINGPTFIQQDYRSDNFYR